MVEVVRPFNAKNERVVMYSFPTEDALLAAVQKTHSDKRYERMEGKPLDLSLSSPIYKITWNKRGIMAEEERVHGITKFIKNHLYPVHEVRRFMRNNGKLSARKARELGKKVDKELKGFATNCSVVSQRLSPEARCVIQSLFHKDVSLFDSGVLVSNKTSTKDTKKQMNVVCNKKIYSGYAGTEIDLIGFDHVKRQVVVIELKITTDHIHNLLKRYDKAKLDKVSGFSKSTIGCYLAQTACSALMFHNVYKLSVLPRALLVICEAGGKYCRVFDVSREAMNAKHFTGWIPGFSCVEK